MKPLFIITILFSLWVVLLTFLPKVFEFEANRKGKKYGKKSQSLE
jgi:hypothetical protein